MEEKRKLILAIDFNNVAFASYYGQHLVNSKGINVNAIKGFFFKLKMLKETFEPDFIVFANDISRKRTFRRKMYPGYKAQRKKHDQDIIDQMRYISQIIALLGFQTLNNELYEADDVLGMISRLGEDNDMDVIIISSDKDMYQLVTDHTFIQSPRNSDFVDKDFMREKYNLTPEQWIELKILQGDRSDNIPGIHGIGERTALELMNKFGSLESIYRRLTEIKIKIRERLISGEKDIEFTRKLVTIITDYKLLDLSVNMLYRTEPFPDELYDVIHELELYSLIDVMRFSLLPQRLDKIEVK